MGTMTFTPAPTAEEIAAQKAAADRQTFKLDRSAAVQRIRVTTAAGHVFDGDETSQNRMSRAINGMAAGDTLLWVLADNTEIAASREELREALRLAGKAQADVWVQVE